MILNEATLIFPKRIFLEKIAYSASVKIRSRRNFVLNIGFWRSPTIVFEVGFVKKSDSKLASWYQLDLLAADANTKIF